MLPGEEEVELQVNAHEHYREHYRRPEPEATFTQPLKLAASPHCDTEAAQAGAHYLIFQTHSYGSRCPQVL